MLCFIFTNNFYIFTCFKKLKKKKKKIFIYYYFFFNVLGRWLYRNPETHYRCEKFLETTMQLKETAFMDQSLKVELENAYFQVCPPEQAAIPAPKKLPPLLLYIRYIHQNKKK